MTEYRLTVPVKHGTKEITDVVIPKIVNFGHLVATDNYNGLSAQALAIVAEENNLPVQLFAEGLSMIDCRYFAQQLEQPINDAEDVDVSFDLKVSIIELEYPVILTKDSKIGSILFPDAIFGDLVLAIDEGIGNHQEVILRAVAHCHNKANDSNVEWFKFKKISGPDVAKVSAKVGYLLGK